MAAQLQRALFILIKKRNTGLQEGKKGLPFKVGSKLHHLKLNVFF